MGTGNAAVFLFEPVRSDITASYHVFHDVFHDGSKVNSNAGFQSGLEIGRCDPGIFPSTVFRLGFRDGRLGDRVRLDTGESICTDWAHVYAGWVSFGFK